MFAYPWNASDDSTENEVDSVFKEIGELNQQLIAHTEKLLHSELPTPPPGVSHGSCRFNLTLINRCFPPSALALKEEPMFGTDQCTVSWHADSSLEHYSSIAVYHCTKPAGFPLEADNDFTEEATTDLKKKKRKRSEETDQHNGQQWRVALRVAPDSEGPASQKAAASRHSSSADLPPPVAVSLPNEWSYFLLDEFNHHHQHSVLAGDSDRYASTHRVSRSEGHTFHYIHKRCCNTLQQKLNVSGKGIRSEQLVLMELEFEWIRQFFVQGRKHYVLHKWWHQPMKELMSCWVKLENRTGIALQALCDAGNGDLSSSSSSTSSSISISCGLNSKSMKKRKANAAAVDDKAYDEMIAALEERVVKREGWLARYVDPLLLKQKEEIQPLDIPTKEHFQPPLLTIQPFLKEILNNGDGNEENNALCEQVLQVTTLKATIERVKRWKNSFTARK